MSEQDGSFNLETVVWRQELTGTLVIQLLFLGLRYGGKATEKSVVWNVSSAMVS